jgi:phosphatidylglycerophosphate synthase
VKRAAPAAAYTEDAMLDAVLRRTIDPPLDAVAKRLVAFNIGADAIALAAFVAGLAAVAGIAYGHYLAGLGLLALNRLLYGLDGAVARATGARSSAALGVTLDTIVLTGIPLGFALADPSRAIAAAFLICALAGASAARIATAPRDGTDFIENAAVFLAFVCACVLPDRFSIVAYVLGVLAFIAAGARVAAVARPT